MRVSSLLTQGQIDRFVLRLQKLSSIALVPGYRDAFRRIRVAPSIEHEGVVSQFEVDSVVDVGASRGQFVVLARHRWPNARILAIEPLSSESAELRDLVSDDPLVTVVNAAVGEEEGEQPFHVSRSSDSSSLLPIGDRQVAEFSGTGEATQTTVKVRRLDSILAEWEPSGRSLLTIDVQGFELAVLRGAGDRLRDFDHVMVEASFVELYQGQALAAEVLAFLADAGFGVRGVYGVSVGKGGVPLQAEFWLQRHGA